MTWIYVNVIGYYFLEYFFSKQTKTIHFITWLVDFRTKICAYHSLCQFKDSSSIPLEQNGLVVGIGLVGSDEVNYPNKLHAPIFAKARKSGYFILFLVL